ncbi:DiGeorge syndrome critical region protein 14 [Apophysomyces ossiformis]|uniref:DiGeorge syndrome critical region protein 14 n=1 Tax=Apophysomyces ossiformis TaxID=679940 RepID=A0A8H7BFJ3_9FUNG|nr:DiGeorge syndrome critical region protein 14 [Apophysomyces ossiformis]
MTSINPVVLDEDTYTEAISFIIERDFFPHLAKSRLQQPQQDRSIPRSNVQNYYNDDALELADRVNLNLSLDQFQTLYTRRVHLPQQRNLTFAFEKARTMHLLLIYWRKPTQNQLRIGDQQSNLKLIEAGDVSPGTWRFNAKNALMYFPDGPSQSVLNEKESRAAPKAISYANTQLDRVMQHPSEMAPSDVAAQKGSLTPWHKLSGDAEESVSSADFRGYNLVPSTPTLSPSRIGTPIMTWGSVEGTPMLIQGSETPGPQFSLPKVSRREELGMKLSEKASRAYRKKAGERERVMRGTPRTG